MTSCQCLYLSKASACIVLLLPTADHLEMLWPVTQGGSYLWSVNVQPVVEDVRFCHTLKYAYMHIVVTGYLWYLIRMQ